MNRKMLLGFITVLMLASVVGLSSASTANSSEVDPAGASYSFTFTGYGQYRHFTPTLESLDDRNRISMTLTTTLTVVVVIADEFLMGDTITAFYPFSWTPVFSATSPSVGLGSARLGPGTYTFYIGYTACPWGFPAGYDIWIIAVV